jgi:hypothetical protein
VKFLLPTLIPPSLTAIAIWIAVWFIARNSRNARNTAFVWSKLYPPLAVIRLGQGRWRFLVSETFYTHRHGRWVGLPLMGMMVWFFVGFFLVLPLFCGCPIGRPPGAFWASIVPGGIGLWVSWVLPGALRAWRASSVTVYSGGLVFSGLARCWEGLQSVTFDEASAELRFCDQWTTTEGDSGTDIVRIPIPTDQRREVNRILEGFPRLANGKSS